MKRTLFLGVAVTGFASACFAGTMVSLAPGGPAALFALTPSAGRQQFPQGTSTLAGYESSPTRNSSEG
jgi:hypothetical protein